MSDINVPISPGELLDKITILRIKSKRMSDWGSDVRAGVRDVMCVLHSAVQCRAVQVQWQLRGR